MYDDDMQKAACCFVIISFHECFFVNAENNNHSWNGYTHTFTYVDTYYMKKQAG